MATKSRVSIDDTLEFDQYLSFTGVQASAGAFLQLTVPTKVSPNNGYILLVKEIVMTLDVFAATNAFNPSLNYSVTRATKAAVPNFTDPDVIAKGSVLGLGGGTFAAGGSGTLEMPINVPFTGKQIIASENVFVQFVAGGFPIALTVSGRIYYEQLNLPKERILEILYG